jgi:PAS domain S-box-containing protein
VGTKPHSPRSIAHLAEVPLYSEHIAQTLRRVMDTIPAMVWSAFPDGSVEYVSDRWLRYIGQSRDKFERQGWEALLHPEDLEKAETQWRSTVAAGRQPSKS